MSQRFSIPLFLLALFGAVGLEAAPPPDPALRPPVAPKTDAVASKLLLPFFRVENNSTGTTTLFAVRNESNGAVSITLRYFESDRPQTPQLTENVSLPAKRVHTVNVRDRIGSLLVDPDGFARGFVRIETDGGEQVLQGDFFQVTGQEDFATGDRLLNVDPLSVHNELCQAFTMRFLASSLFSAGTLFTIWLDLDQPPIPTQPVLTYEVFNEAGTSLFSGNLPIDEVAFTVSAQSLFAGQPAQPNFGAIELSFGGTLGHVSAVMSANGRFSVGFKGLCRDFGEI